MGPAAGCEMELLPVLREIRRGRDDQFDTEGDGRWGGRRFEEKKRK